MHVGGVVAAVCCCRAATEGAILVSVLIDPDVLVDDFAASADKAAINGWPCTLRPELLPAPHMPPALRAGYGAVYALHWLLLHLLHVEPGQS